MSFIFLLGGLVLGWSLGANNTADIFGTAVGTRMVKLRTALIVASIFVVLGAVLQGSNTTKSIGELGRINAIGGAFTVCLATGLTVIWMTRAGFLVSITQALVGGIVGWTIFSGDFINTSSLGQIFEAWVISPLIAFILALLLYKLTHSKIIRVKLNLFTIDYYFRLAFITLGALGAFSFGANNIANIVGVYIFSNPFKNLYISGFNISAYQLLIFIGSLSISAGILTGSEKVMKTVGERILKLSPLAGLVVVLTQSIVLLIFSSDIIKKVLVFLHLPPLPLVPISSSQVVIGAMIGIGIARGGGRLVNFGVLKHIVLAWVITPIAAGILSFFMLYFAQNVFQIVVKYPVRYQIDRVVIEKLKSEGLDTSQLRKVSEKVYPNGRMLKMELQRIGNYSRDEINRIIDISRIDSIIVDSTKLNELPEKWFTPVETEALKNLHGRKYAHAWQMWEDLSGTEYFINYETRKDSTELKKKRELLTFLFRHTYK